MGRLKVNAGAALNKRKADGSFLIYSARERNGVDCRVKPGQPSGAFPTTLRIVGTLGPYARP
jgi:hypothetical protein